MLRRYLSLLLSYLLCQFSFGCAYYNTFYNAKRDYSQAMKEKSRSPTQKAPAAALDKCIERCGKLIQHYPNSRWVDDAMLLMGKCYHEKGEYSKALSIFDKISVYYPGSLLLQEAHFMKGQSYLKQGDYLAAVAAFQTAGALGGNLQEPSALKVAESYVAGQEYEDAAAAATRFLSDHPKTRLRAEALKTLGDALFEKGELREAIAEYEELLLLKPKRKIFFEVSLKIGAAHLMLGEVESAFETLSALKKRAVDEKERSQLSISIADCQRALGRPEEALQTLKEVTERAPVSDEAEEAFYKMGLIYEEDLANLDEARKSYDRVRERGSPSRFAQEALLKSSSIGKLTEYRKSLGGGEESELAKTQFLLAELYLVDLGKPEQAVVEYEKVLSDFPTSDYAPKAVFAIAWVCENIQGDTARAVAAYERVIAQYPETPYARASQEAIARLRPRVDTLSTEDQRQTSPQTGTSGSNE